MDKIQKALNKFSPREQRWVKEILQRLQSDNTMGLNIQKLQGQSDIYRIRKGDVRIIVRKNPETFFLLAIERRSEKTYRDY